MSKIRIFVLLVCVVLGSVCSAMTEEAAPYVKWGTGHDPVSHKTVLQDVPSGTLFIWGNGKWVNLTEITENESDREITALRRLDPHTQTFIISHGWRDDRLGQTIDLAKALSKRFPDANILGVDWSSTAWTDEEGPFSLSANFPARFIPWVATGIVEQLGKLYGQSQENLRIDDLHLIGHSHGAHVLGMVAHKLNFKPKRFTALDASTMLSHLLSFDEISADVLRLNPITGFTEDIVERFYGDYKFDKDGNVLGLGWSRDDVEFLEYYKSSVMASTNTFKGHNNFILIGDKNKFEFSEYADPVRQGHDHGYSIEWYAKTISADPRENHLGFNMSKDYLLGNWTGDFNYDQYHGVINGALDRIENFDMKFTRLTDGSRKYTGDWKYTKPWYGPIDQAYQFLFNDKVFRDDLAKTIEYEPTGLNYSSARNYFLCGVPEIVSLSVANNADNITIPKDVRVNETENQKQDNVIALYVGRKGTKCRADNQENGRTKIGFTQPVYLLTSSNHYIDAGQIVQNPLPGFVIPESYWSKLGGTKKDEFIDCEFFVLSGIEREKKQDLPEKSTSFDIWAGELYPYNNVTAKTLKIKNPKLKDDEDNPSPNIVNYLPIPFLDKFYLGINYNCTANLKAQDYYKAHSNYGLGLMFGYTKYFPSAVATKFGNFGLDFIGALDYAKYNNAIIAVHDPDNSYDTEYKTHLKGLGNIAFVFGSSYTYRINDLFTVAPYFHGTASLIIPYFQDSDGENYGMLGLGFGLNTGLRITIAKHLGLSFGWKYTHCNDVSLVEKFFDEDHDYHTQQAKLNLNIKSINVGVFLTF